MKELDETWSSLPFWISGITVPKTFGTLQDKERRKAYAKYGYRARIPKKI